MRKAAATSKEIVQRKYAKARCRKSIIAGMYAVFRKSTKYTEVILGIGATPAQAWKRAEKKLRKGNSKRKNKRTKKE